MCLAWALALIERDPLLVESRRRGRYQLTRDAVAPTLARRPVLPT